MSWSIQDKYAVATVNAQISGATVALSNNRFYLPVFKEIDDGLSSDPVWIHSVVTDRQPTLPSYASAPDNKNATYTATTLGASAVRCITKHIANGAWSGHIYVPCTNGETVSISHTNPYLYDHYPASDRYFLLEDSNGKYTVWIYKSYPTVSWGSFETVPLGEGYVPLYDSSGFVFVENKDDPIVPEMITELVVEPNHIYSGKGQERQFKAYYYYSTGDTPVEARDVSWSVEPQVGTINSAGLLSLDDEIEYDKCTVTAKSRLVSDYPNLQGNATVFIDIYSTGNDIDTGNQYFPGGISGGSGIPQGGYNNTFGPNVSSLIPGLDSAGNSTGQGGAVGNDISLSGMYTKYLMNQQYLNTLAQFFWEDNIGIQAMKLAFGNPIDSIISLISYPFNLDLLVPSVQQNIFFGKYDSLFPGRAISRSSFQIDWGTISIDFYWGNFLDYAPYTQVQLYLPWGIGFVSIDPNEVMPYSNVPNDFNPVNYNKGSIRVVTNIELDKGACVHNVIGNNGLVIGSYAGIVGKQIPMTALDQGAKTLALLGAASGIGLAAANAMAGAATGKYTSVTPKYSTVGYGNNNWVQSLGFEHKFDGGQMWSDMGGSKAMKAGLASAAALASTPPNYPRAGTFSDATNTMCAQVPYIIISRPSQSVPQNYGHYNGYPSNIYYKKLSFVSGYTEISEIHLDNVPGSVEELEELDSMLKGGVLL